MLDVCFGFLGICLKAIIFSFNFSITKIYDLVLGILVGF